MLECGDAALNAIDSDSKYSNMMPEDGCMRMQAHLPRHLCRHKQGKEASVNMAKIAM